MSPAPSAAFRAAIENADVPAALALFTEDVTFHSPVVHRPYQGKAGLGAVLSAVLTVFEDFRYVAEYGEVGAGDDGGHVLVFRARVDGREVHGVDILSAPDANGLLTDLTVMLRPYSAATAVKERMAAALAGGAPA